MKKQVVTRKNEERFQTSDLSLMAGKFTAEKLLRGWKEDFVDEDTGEVVSIERNEIVIDKGVLIDNEMLARINFHLQAGDIHSVVVSNQRRDAEELISTQLYPYLAVAKIKDKSTKILLYASSVVMASEICKDFIELNFYGGFVFTQIKELPPCILLNDTLRERKVDTIGGIARLPRHEDDPFDYIEKAYELLSEDGEDQEAIDYKFYQIDVTIAVDDDGFSYPQSFIIKTKDVDKAMHVIQYYLNNEAQKNGDHGEISIKLEGAKLFPANIFVDKDFSLAYS